MTAYSCLDNRGFLTASSQPNLMRLVATIGDSVRIVFIVSSLRELKFLSVFIYVYIL